MPSQCAPNCRSCSAADSLASPANGRPPLTIGSPQATSTEARYPFGTRTSSATGARDAGIPVKPISGFAPGRPGLFGLPAASTVRVSPDSVRPPADASVAAPTPVFRKLRRDGSTRSITAWMLSFADGFSDTSLVGWNLPFIAAALLAVCSRQLCPRR
jgi:hypothetical protein